MLRLGLMLLLISMACTGPSISFSDLELELELSRCKRLARCGLFPDEETCQTYFAPVPDPSLASAIGRTVIYDGERAKQCVDALAELGCDTTARDVRVPPRACTEMLRGKVADHGVCYFSTECKSGLCVKEPGCPSVGCCAGTCKSKLESPIGGPCESSRDCVGDAFCGEDLACHPLAAVGQDCRADADCQYSLACINPLPTSPGTCRAIGHEGDPCPYLRCADEGLRCAENTCVSVGLPGAACVDFTDCSPYMQCDAQTLRCREFPLLGQPCDVACQGTAWCARPTGSQVGTCAEPQENGAPCNTNNECATFSCQEGPVFDSCQDAPVCVAE